MKTPYTIMQAVCDYFDIDAETLRSRQRDAYTAEARQICCYLIREYNPRFSYDSIGAIVKRAGCVAFYAVHVIENRLSIKDAVTTPAVYNLRKILEAL
jgi:chromosomal replication initiation ATPase DnaA